MMLWLPMPEETAGRRAGLGVVHVTLHESLSCAVARLTTEGIVQASMRLAGLLTPLLGRRPRLAVARSIHMPGSRACLATRSRG